jgi:hypothetical protein
MFAIKILVWHLAICTAIEALYTVANTMLSFMRSTGGRFLSHPVTADEKPVFEKHNEYGYQSSRWK